MSPVPLVRRRWAAALAALALVSTAGAASPAMASEASTSSATATIELEVPVPMVVADGVSTLDLTATVTDPGGDGVGHTVTFESSDPGHVLTTPSDNGDGTYTATLTSTTTVTSATITARLENGASATTTVWQVTAMPEKLDSAAANLRVTYGVPTAVRIKLVDVNGAPVDGVPVTASVSLFPLGESPSEIVEVRNPGDGFYEVIVIPLGELGRQQRMSFSWPGARTSQGVGFTPVAGPPALVTVELSEPSITADGSTTTTATATVTDAFGHPVAGDVVLTSDWGNEIGDPVPGATGVYAFEVTSTTVAGSATLTATLADGAKDTVELVQVAGPPASMNIEVVPRDPKSPAGPFIAIVTVVDEHGNPVPGLTVDMTSDGPQTVSDVVEESPGVYVAEIDSPEGEDSFTITVETDTGLSDSVLVTIPPAEEDDPVEQDEGDDAAEKDEGDDAAEQDEDDEAAEDEGAEDEGAEDESGSDEELATTGFELTSLGWLAALLLLGGAALFGAARRTAGSHERS